MLLNSPRPVNNLSLFASLFAFTISLIRPKLFRKVQKVSNHLASIEYFRLNLSFFERLKVMSASADFWRKSYRHRNGRKGSLCSREVKHPFIISIWKKKYILSHKFFKFHYSKEEFNSVAISALHCVPASRPENGEKTGTNINNFHSKMSLLGEDIGNPFRLSQLQKISKTAGFEVERITDQVLTETGYQLFILSK